MLPDRVLNPGPLTYESDALPIALRGPAYLAVKQSWQYTCTWQKKRRFFGVSPVLNKVGNVILHSFLVLAVLYHDGKGDLYHGLHLPLRIFYQVHLLGRAIHAIRSSSISLVLLQTINTFSAALRTV